MFRRNWRHPPFDNQKIRQAAIASLAQEPFLQATIGNPEYYKVCAAMFVCDTPFAFTEGGEKLLKSDFEKSKALLKEAGYDGTPVVIMHSTDLPAMTHRASLDANLTRERGLTVHAPHAA